MPTSWYQAIPNVLTQVKKLNPQSILDIGVGFGKYGLLYRDLLEIPFERYHKQDWQVKIDGVEAFAGYRNSMYDFVYDNVFFGNVLDVIDTLWTYDCITMIDVLEHFSKQEGLLLLRKLVEHCTGGLIVSTPFYPDKQSEYLSNTFEEHKSVWSIADFASFNFSYERIEIDENGAHLFIFQPNAAKKDLPFASLAIDSSIEKKPLKIAYLLPHKNLTGGLKMLLQQMKYLRQRGHTIVACLKDTDGTGIVLPKWFDLEVDEEISVPRQDLFVNYTAHCDVLVAGWVTQLYELQGSTVPVMYWEQGSEWLFGDCNNQKQSSVIHKILEQCYVTHHAIVSVSPYVANTISARFGRQTPILPNGIDTDFYCPANAQKSNTNKILLIGNPHLAFKGFDLAFKALNLVWMAGYRFHVEWVCQAPPKIPHVPYKIATVLQPPQDVLVKCYQNADIHLFTSWYEGFGMPPLEAMACRTAVVCTRCGGIDSFAKQGYNALLSDGGDTTLLAANIAALLKYPHLRDALAENGRITAEQFSYSRTILELEAYLYAILQSKRVAPII